MRVCLYEKLFRFPAPFPKQHWRCVYYHADEFARWWLETRENNVNADIHCREIKTGLAYLFHTIIFIYDKW